MLKGTTRLSMRTLLLGIASFLLLKLAPANAAGVEFPEPAQLPARPGLPDPLVMSNGEPVTTKEPWFEKRRPELKALFQHYMYGYLPAPAKVTTAVERLDRNYFGGKATKKEVVLAVGPPEVPRIHVLLVVPNQRKQPAPVFVGANTCGNFMVIDDPTVPVPTAWMRPIFRGVKDHRATEEGRGSQANVWNLEQTIARGYAVATFYNGDVDPDRKDCREGLQPWLR